MTEQATDLSAITRSIVVSAPQQRCFETFTTGADAWWPREHYIGESELDEAVLEPGKGRRWYERSVDGSECDWGVVLAWEPPERVLLSWDIGPDWRYDPSARTEVEVRFHAEGPSTTRVELEHRGFERLGDRAAEMRSAVGSGEGWGGSLEAFAKVAEAG